jgi:hypothetical protein
MILKNSRKDPHKPQEMDSTREGVIVPSPENKGHIEIKT